MDYYPKFITGLWKIFNKIKIKVDEIKEIFIEHNKFNDFQKKIYQRAVNQRVRA